MADSELSELLIPDIWDTFPERFREEFLAARVDSTGWGAYGRQESDSRRWEPLRPVVVEERAYRRLESDLARLLHLAVDACGRRASTLGELHQALRFPLDLPLMDPDRPLVASELTRYARPDLLIEQGRPKLLEFNNSTRLGGGVVTPRLAEAFAQLCPQGGLRPPPSVVAARSAALIRSLGGEVGNGEPRRLLVPTYWSIDGTGERHYQDKIKKAVVADARRVGFEVVQADLAEVRLDSANRLFAGDVPIDLVLIHWGCDARIVDDGGGLAALRGADRAGTVELFPRTESVLIASKAVLAWLHEDCDAGLLAPADHDLVRNYIPRTTCLGLTGDSVAPEFPPHMATGERDRLIVKPAVGKSGDGVLFGSHTSEQDWLAATVHAARDRPVVLQQRVEPDHISMSFLDRDSGQQVTAEVPLVLSPYMIDGAASSVGVRHMGPEAPASDVVISVSKGARSNTVLLADAPGERIGVSASDQLVGHRGHLVGSDRG
jgi:hypothetical protein